jgi:CheY-like chemotaxis protein
VFLPSVFDRFQQADSSTTRTHGGLGIGLAIVRHLVELHGGAVSAESEGDDQGSTFRVWLPAVALGVSALEKERALPPASTPAPVRDTADLTGLRVLLVEDERDGRELLTETVRAAGAETLATESAREAFQSLASFRPDVLVSDVAMPVEDGYSLVRRMRRLAPEEGGRIPAIAVSAYAREEDRIRSLAAGFQHHIAKPLDPADLIGAIARLARRGRVAPVPDPQRNNPSVEPSISTPISGGNGLLTATRVLIVEDDGDAREGLRSLLEMWGHEVDVAEDGLRGIEKAVANLPDVALIDVGLPGIDGYQVAVRLAEVLGDHSIFLVALTGYASAEDRSRAFESGFHAHLAKPINYAKLSSLLSDEGNRRSAPLENASEA